MVTNSDEVWEDLLTKHPAATVFAGITDDDEHEFQRSGHWIWSNMTHLLPDKTRVLEYGAGNGRIAQAAAPDCGQIIAYEPVNSARALLVERLAHFDNATVVGREILDAADLMLSAVYCCNVLQHLAYDDVYTFLLFCGANVSPTAAVIVNYIPFTAWGRLTLCTKKQDSGWPSYIWHEEQITSMFGCFGFGLLDRFYIPKKGMEAVRVHDCYQRREGVAQC